METVDQVAEATGVVVLQAPMSPLRDESVTLSGLHPVGLISRVTTPRCQDAPRNRGVTALCRKPPHTRGRPALPWCIPSLDRGSDTPPRHPSTAPPAAPNPKPKLPPLGPLNPPFPLAILKVEPTFNPASSIQHPASSIKHPASRHEPILPPTISRNAQILPPPGGVRGGAYRRLQNEPILAPTPVNDEIVDTGAFSASRGISSVKGKAFVGRAVAQSGL